MLSDIRYSLLLFHFHPNVLVSMTCTEHRALAHTRAMINYIKQHLRDGPKYLHLEKYIRVRARACVASPVRGSADVYVREFRVSPLESHGGSSQISPRTISLDGALLYAYAVT